MVEHLHGWQEVTGTVEQAFLGVHQEIKIRMLSEIVAKIGKVTRKHARSK